MSFARVIQPCERYFDHLLSDFVADSGVQDTDVTRTTLRAFGDISLIVLELDYFDVDYRSEFSAVLEDSFAVADHRTARLHFFRNTPRYEGPTDLRERLEEALAPSSPPPATPAGVGADPPWVGDPPKSSNYLGYVVIRPQSPGTIGRSIVAPAEGRPELTSGHTVEAHVRTIIREPVDIFGLKAQAYGVPFMEQDGRLLRCAHVAAWMCHYTAVLRGMANRLRTAEFNPVSGNQPSLGRRYPSSGLTDVMLSKVFRNVGFPAESFSVSSLVKRRPALWTDRQAMYERATSPEIPLSQRTRDDLEFWLRENLTAVTCRYLNSGLPLVLALNHAKHAQVICGYVRDEDLEAKAEGADSSHSDVAAFLVNDDLAGPFRLVRVDDLIKEAFRPIHGDARRSFSLLVPLPRGLWLEGGTAEATGVEAIGGACDELAEWLSQRGKALSTRAAEIRDFVHRRQADDDVQSAGYAVRSFAMTGTDFKRSFSEVVDDPRAARAMCKVQLPKYVWVVEVLDRALRPGPNDEARPAVLATAVVDGSAVATAGWGAARIPVLAVHLPGHMSTYMTDWTEVTDEPRYTCRWNHYREWLTSPQAAAERAKES